MGLEDGINFLETVFFKTEFGGLTWIFHLIIIFATLLIITRVWKDWATLGLPVMVGWEYFGINIPYPFLIIGVIVFVIDVLSIKVISGALSGTGDALYGLGKSLSGRSRLEREIKRINIKDEMNRMNFKVSGEGELMREIKRRKESQGRLEEIKRFAEGDKKEEEIDKRSNFKSLSSWEAFQKYGSKGIKKPKGELSKQMSEKARELGRKLTDIEIKELYDKIGGRNMRGKEE